MTNHNPKKMQVMNMSEKTGVRIVGLMFFLVGMCIVFSDKPGWVPLVGGLFLWLGQHP